MTPESVRYIKASGAVQAEIVVPPSKSYTNRALIAAALADGETVLRNPSVSEDSMVLMNALKQFGVGIAQRENSWLIDGRGGVLVAPKDVVFVGNAGTAMRFLTTFAALSHGTTTLDGDDQMRRRPMGDLLEALQKAGVHCRSDGGYPPITIEGDALPGGRIDITAAVSSQFLSSLLLAAPYAHRPVTIVVKGALSSLPYIDMTLHVMRSFGAEIDVSTPTVYRVQNKQRYIGHEFTVEGDASSATYFFAAAAITAGRVTVTNLTPESLQGDLRFLALLSEMGCRIERTGESITVQGGKLYGIETDMNDIPDCAPTLAVVAAFADGATSITNVRHLRFKETDRLTALARELTKIGAKVELLDDGLTISPRKLQSAVIETYNDHRMAMSFAVAGLRIDGLAIANPGCVAKSFPAFWEEFQKVESKG